MKRTLFTLLLTAILLSLGACSVPEELPDAVSSEQKEDIKGNTLMEFYDKSKADFDLKLFAIQTPKSQEDDIDARVAIISDNHYKGFSGVGGYTDAERQDKMIEALTGDPVGLDCVIFAGDMVNQNELLKKQAEQPREYPEGLNWVEEWKSTYFDRLKRYGMKGYVINASHDAMLPDEFEAIFDYPSNYVVLVGTTAYICVDTYSGERFTESVLNADGSVKKATYETTMADIPSDFVTEVGKLLRHEYVQNAFIVCHAYSGDRTRAPHFYQLLAEEKVLGVVYGHSHFNYNGTVGGKPAIQTGHFSRGHTKMVTQGLGFKPFVPLNNDVVGTTTDEDGKENRKDYSATGSPWQYRVIEFAGTSDSYTLEAYQVFPEMSYEEFKSDGILFPSFTQPYTEARPSFLGADAVVDRSYLLVKEVK